MEPDCNLRSVSPLGVGGPVGRWKKVPNARYESMEVEGA
jgi:hypothetical protein